MSKYRLYLRPLGKFFFGGDMTFKVGEDDTDPHNVMFSSYILESNLYPQQTTLLGMLRFLILKNAGPDVFKEGRIQDTEQAGKLIGEQGFRDNNGKLNDFGVIKGLSHCRIEKRENGLQRFLEIAEFILILNAETRASISETGGYDAMKRNTPKEWEAFNAKEGVVCRKLYDGDASFDIDEIFIPARQVGIDRDIKTGKVGDNALYKQVFYVFNDKVGEQNVSYRFTFDADVENVDLEDYNGQLVSIGADHSYFQLEVEELTASNDQAGDDADKVVLLSPSIIPLDLFKVSSYAITLAIPFRFQKTRNGDYLSGSKTNAFRIDNKSEKYMLYSAGSVFFFTDSESKQKFMEGLENRLDFRQIGYNEYK